MALNLSQLNNVSDVLKNKDSDGGKPMLVRIDDIIEDPDQPRKAMDQDSLQELADSIKSYGVLQPILVRPAQGEDGRYLLIAGHRRLAASKMAGKGIIPIFLDEGSSSETSEKLPRQLAENIHRENLNPLEIAASLQCLIDMGHKQKDLVSMINKSKSYVSEHMALLDLPDHIKDLCAQGKCTTLRALLAFKGVSAEHQDALKEALQEVDGNITIKDAMRLVQRIENPEVEQNKGTDVGVSDGSIKPESFAEGESFSESSSAGEKEASFGGDEYPGASDGFSDKVEKMKKPALYVSKNGNEATVLLKKIPSYDGAIWIKFIHDGGEEEVDAGHITLLAVRETDQSKGIEG